jgi:hypothetical protein
VLEVVLAAGEPAVPAAARPAETAAPVLEAAPEAVAQAAPELAAVPAAARQRPLAPPAAPQQR